MEVIEGSPYHAHGVAAFWNANAEDPESWGNGSPDKTGEEIVALPSNGFPYT